MRVPKSLRDGLKKLAFFEGKTMGDLITEAIEEKLRQPVAAIDTAGEAYRVIRDRSLAPNTLLINTEQHEIRMAS
jgi:hypothetical protein